MKKIYGVIIILIIMVFSIFVINLQNNNQTIVNNNNSHYHNVLYITYYSNSNIQYSFTNKTNNSSISFTPDSISTSNMEFYIVINSNNYINSLFENLLSTNAYAGAIIYLSGTVWVGSTSYAFNQSIPALFGSNTFGSISYSFAARFTAANLNISTTDIYFYGASPLISYDTQEAYSTYFNAIPQSFIFNSITYSDGTNFYNPVFYYYYYLASSLQIHNVYSITFTDYTAFNLLIDGSNYTSVNNQVVITLPNGSYSYSFYINGNYSTLLSSSISVYGTPRTINLAYGHSVLLNLQALVYIALTMILLVAIIRMSGNLFSIYGISALFFMYIGYELHIQYFGTTLIMTVITLISGLFVYKVILE